MKIFLPEIAGGGVDRFADRVGEEDLVFGSSFDYKGIAVLAGDEYLAVERHWPFERQVLLVRNTLAAWTTPLRPVVYTVKAQTMRTRANTASGINYRLAADAIDILLSSNVNASIGNRGRSVNGFAN